MKLFKQWLNSKNIRNNLKKTIITVGLIPIFICGLIVYFFLSAVQWNTITEQADNQATRMADSINTVLSSAIDYSSAIALNGRILNGIGTDFFEDTAAKVEFYEMLDIYFDNYKTSSEVEETECIVYHNNPSLFKSKHTLPLSALDDELCDTLLGQTYDKLYWVNYDDRASIYRPMQNTGQYQAVLCFSIPYARFERQIAGVRTDEYENIYFGIQQPTEKNALVFTKNLINETCLYTQIPLSIKHDIYRRNLLVVSLALAAIMGLLIATANLLSRLLTQKVDRFIDTLNQSETLEDFRTFQVDCEDEFAAIYNKIKALIQRIDDMHVTLNQTLLEKNMLELEYMQSKINPHLLYNSLSSMKWSAMDRGDEAAAKNISDLTQYYRAVLSGGRHIITLAQELDLVKKYIKVMEFAHRHTYPCEIQIEDALNERMTIKHLLQPFVENAILHGINRQKGGLIQIKGQLQNDRIVLSVQDNGCGIPEDKLREIKELRYDSDYRSYGIKNTLRRIRLYYGTDSTITIDSRPDCGTTVTITLCDLKSDELYEQYHFLNT